MTSIDWIIELLSGPFAFFIGVFSGVAAHFIGSWVWMWYKKPDLEFLKWRPEFEAGEDGSLESRVFMARVKNQGREAASNCKPEFKLRGNLEGDRYVIQGNIRWEEGQHPARITINQEETVSFPVYKLTAEQSGNIVQSAPEFSIQFPTDDGWASSANIMKWERDEDGQIENAKFLNELSLQEFYRIKWEIQEVRVTAENAKMLAQEFRITSDVQGEMGLTGMQPEWVDSQ